MSKIYRWVLAFPTGQQDLVIHDADFQKAGENDTKAENARVGTLLIALNAIVRGSNDVDVEDLDVLTFLSDKDSYLLF